MTTERILAVCRTNWEYRGIDDASVREMLAELEAHLQDAGAAGRAPRDVVGEDVRAFAASWARARQPLRRRILRMAALVPFVLGVSLLLPHLFQWSTTVPVTPARLTFLAAAAAVVAVELRRGALGLGKNWLIALVVILPAALLVTRLAGDEPLFTVPLWGTALMLLPGAVHLAADRRGARNASAPPPGG
ncbi:hypothetical protein ACLGI4_27425 [Streptomyces sp. HMX112]|uniref:hypothetical protein n=1 Tax=Streptomyces sp. HMX112 TaxID=3390850 RepID=UPI003A80A924